MIVFEESVDLKVGEQRIVVRRLQERDSLEELTALLHGAFSRLKKMDFYGHHGYRAVESIHFPGKNYRSVVLSKTLANRHAAPALISSLLDFSRRCMTIAAECLHRGERIERRLAA